MKLLNFFRKEKGSVSVIVALAMVVLLGSTALAVDYGNLASEKRSFQNALDSAALAGVRELPDYTKAKRVAIDYLEYNGVADAEERVNRGEIQIFQSADGEELTVRGTNDVDYFFAAIFGGGTSGKVGGNATAKKAVGGFFADNDCALLSLSETVPMQIVGGATTNIQDPIHSNYKVVFGDSSSYYAKVSSRLGVDYPSYWVWDMNKYMGSSTIVSEVKTLPTVDTLYDVANKPSDSELASYGVVKSGNTYTFSSYESSGTHCFSRLTGAYGSDPIYIDGDVVISNGNFNSTGTIVAKGNITVTATDTDMISTNSACLVSLEGGINIVNCQADLRGIIFAPNGTVKIDTYNGTLTGAVIADNIHLNNGTFGIVFDPEAGAHVPVGGGNAKLVA